MRSGLGGFCVWKLHPDPITVCDAGELLAAPKTLYGCAPSLVRSLNTIAHHTNIRGSGRCVIESMTFVFSLGGYFHVPEQKHDG